MSSPTLLSDDDDSFDEDDMKIMSNKEEIIDVSSDATEDYYTSDDEELPTVDVKRSIKRNLFPVEPKPSTSNSNLPWKYLPNARGDDEELPTVDVKRSAIIRNLFPVQPKPSTSNSNLPGKIAPNAKGDSSQHVSTRTESVTSEPKAPQVERMIGGVKVVLPVQPYGSQTVLMYKLITAIKTCQNCLLESPTGSGKTLALLCGALSWVQQERCRIAVSQANQFTSQYPEISKVDGAVNFLASPYKDQAALENAFSTTFGQRSIYDKPQDVGGPSNSKRQEPMQDLPYCDGRPAKSEVMIHKKRKLNGTPDKWKSNSHSSTPEKPVVVGQPETPEEVKNLYSQIHSLQLQTTMYLDCRVPIIYYGARTHKQLQQVIKEFSRTAYCGQVNMTVLSSRDYSCIRELDRSLWKNKNDMCRGCTKTGLSTAQKKRTETNCQFYNNKQAITHQTLPPAFDLEDLVRVGNDKRACPYYAAREMAKTAQIVFCPYNYLIEPGIRSSMGIDLQDNIVIIDEAHNIEDICRDAASCTITRDNVQASIAELENCLKYRYSNQDALNYIEYLLLSLKNWDQWFNNQMALVRSKPINNNEAVHTWEVEHFATTLNNHNIGDKQYREFSEAAQVLVRRLRESPDVLYGVTQTTGTLIETLDTVLGYVFRDSGQYKDDFKPALVRTVSGNGDLSVTKSWRNSQFDKWVDKESLSLRLLCLNPAVVFAGLSTARCVVLSSGTLTPLLSLHSELHTPFPLRVSPSHVIAEDRVWIGTLTTCPDGSPLECTSRGTERTSVQDALGECVRWTCQVTPHGVLCFLPSYSLMNKLHSRWQETGLWRKLNDLKHVFMECRNAKDHNDIMEDYYKYVSTSKGALLFAVYRGKVSEGMDFKDHQARAVITVGVPYPNTFDMAVKEKMAYNDKYCAARQLLSSKEWLRVQAYRALNQAVGRCVRHRLDWGAVLLVDARFQKPYYTEHLSAWVRKFLGNNHHTFDSLVNSSNGLETFMQNMKIKENEDMEC